MGAWIWGAIGAALLAAEVLTPGYFLIFPAAAAFAVGLVSFGIAMSLSVELLVFGGLTALAFAVAIKPYRRAMGQQSQSPVNTTERLLGAAGIIEDAIIAGRGKIRLGDTVWLARGPDLPKGRAVIVAAVDGTVLVVEPRD